MHIIVSNKIENKKPTYSSKSEIVKVGSLLYFTIHNIPKDRRTLQLKKVLQFTGPQLANDQPIGPVLAQ